MSFFDPQGLYVHRQKSTRKGQIIQKKPKHIIGALSKEDRDEAIKIIRCFGLKAVPKNAPVGPVTTVYHDSKFMVLPLSFTNTTTSKSITFNDIFAATGTYFNNLFNHTQDDFDSFYLEFQINTFEYILNVGASTDVEVTSNKISWTYTHPSGEGIVAISDTKNQFKYTVWRQTSYGNQFTQAITEPDNDYSMASIATDSADVYYQLAGQGSLTDDVDVITATASRGILTNFNVIVSIYIDVGYKAQAVAIEAIE